MPKLEIVSQHAHAAGQLEPQSFEDNLRELLRNSPYLVVSALLHLIVLLLVTAASAELPVDPARKIVASAPDLPAVLPKPPESKPPQPLDKPKDVRLDPVVAQPENTPLDELADSDAPYLGEIASPSPNSEIGTGFGSPDGQGGVDSGKLGGDGSDAPQKFIASIHDGLAWLANHQNPDGFWSAAAFDVECGKQGDDVLCDGLGSPQFDVGVTGLSLLAFLGAGNTHKRGEHSVVVNRGLRFLTQVQSPDGNFGQASNPQHTYDHVIATLAMVEAYGRSGRDLQLRAPAERALRYLYRIRNPGGAWRYAGFHAEMSTTPNDMSVTGWAILAMTLAKDLELPLDETALEDALLFLEEMTDPVTGVTGYTARGSRPARQRGTAEFWPDDQTESMTAVGVLCRIFADPELVRPGNREMVEKGIALLTRLPPVWDDAQPGRRDFYYWYYGAYATYQYGKGAWAIWERSLESAIAEHQHSRGELRGSWDPQEDPWGSVGGRVYSTATLTLCMEVFHRYTSVMDPKRYAAPKHGPKRRSRDGNEDEPPR